jgi:class 3 adenylate cyclase/FixJ family two-component response regulator
VPTDRLRVLLADDNLIVREGLRSLLSLAADLEVVGVAGDYSDVVEQAERLQPQVVVTDIRMPPNFQQEGIDAAREIRRRQPGTGIVVLSQYDAPEYAIALLSGGASGCAYLLKDRVAEQDQLIRSIREVSAGGTVLDPVIVECLTRPITAEGNLSPDEEGLLRMVAEGRPVKAISVAGKTTPEDISRRMDQLFLKLARQASAGAQGALLQLQRLHQAIVLREEQGRILSRFLPGGVAEQVIREGRPAGEAIRLRVTVLMSDVRGYSAIAEAADPTRLARQLQQHRTAMSHALLDHGGTVMQFVGDAVMGVFGAPVVQEGHAASALAAATAAHEAQDALNERWARDDIPAFPLGIGLSTGEVAAALLGSEERLEYSLVGDCVNLAQRLQELAGPGEIVLSEGTWLALDARPAAHRLGPVQLKGRRGLVSAYRLGANPQREISTSL